MRSLRRAWEHVAPTLSVCRASMLLRSDNFLSALQDTLKLDERVTSSHLEHLQCFSRPLMDSRQRREVLHPDTASVRRA
jgi:hypothetical protein